MVIGLALLCQGSRRSARDAGWDQVSMKATASGMRAVFTQQGSGAWHVRLNALVWKQSRAVGGGTMPHSELFKTG